MMLAPKSLCFWTKMTLTIGNDFFSIYKVEDTLISDSLNGKIEELPQHNPIFNWQQQDIIVSLKGHTVVC